MFSQSILYSQRVGNICTLCCHYWKMTHNSKPDRSPSLAMEVERFRVFSANLVPGFDNCRLNAWSWTNVRFLVLLTTNDSFMKVNLDLVAIKCLSLLRIRALLDEIKEFYQHLPESRKIMADYQVWNLLPTERIGALEEEGLLTKDEHRS